MDIPPYRPPVTRLGRLCVAGLLLFSLAQAPVLHAAVPHSADQAQSELAALRGKMQALQKRLATARKQQDSLQNSLAEAELAISRSNQRLAALEQRQRSGRNRLATQQDKLRLLRTRMNEQQGMLASLLRSAYTSGEQDTIKLLLNQEDPAALGRMLTYHHYFASARSSHIEALRRDVAEVQQLNRDIQQQNRRLEALTRQQQQQGQKLLAQKQQRKVLLQQLAKEIQSGDSRLKRMQADESRLGRLLDDLHRIIEDTAPPLTGKKDFAQMRGKLDWPNPGPIVHAFGTPRKLGNLKWQGVFIGAKPGQPVRAIHHGRVAFADWLRGFGLLVIIDHGDGYMSLYGHNEELLTHTGDWVAAGEVLAHTGASGGQEQPGVFFSIRRNGKPTNPRRWCRSGNQRHALVSP